MSATGWRIEPRSRQRAIHSGLLNPEGDSAWGLRPWHRAFELRHHDLYDSKHCRARESWVVWACYCSSMCRIALDQASSIQNKHQTQIICASWERHTHPRNRRGQQKSSSQLTTRRCEGHPQRMKTWNREVLSKCDRRGWSEDDARERKFKLGHSSKSLTDRFLSTAAYAVKKADSQVLARFAQNLLFLDLNLSSNDYSLLERDQNDWLQQFRNDQTNLFELLNTTYIPTQERKSRKKQTTSIFRRLFECFGDTLNSRQHDIDLNYIARENEFLCASRLHVFYSCRFECFDSKKMHSILSSFKIFAEISSSNLSNAREWSLCIMTRMSVRLSNDRLILCPDSCGRRRLIML